jgi:tight adherence protein B
VSLYLAHEPLRRLLSERFGRIETERIALVERGLWKEFLFIQPERLKRNTRRALLTGFLLSLACSSPFPVLLAAAFIWFAPAASICFLTNRRRKQLQGQLSRALPTISATLRAGHTFERAVETLTRTESPPISQEFELVLKEIRFGTTLEQALENLVRRCPLRDLEVMVRAVQISARAGSNLAEAFDRVAEMVRARTLLKDRVSALTAQGRLQAWVSIGLPAALLPVLQLVDPGYLAPLFETGAGRLLLGVAGAALLVGGVWIHRISRMEFLQ